MEEKRKFLDALNLDRVINQLTKFIELKMEIYELKVKEQLVDIISSFATLILILSFGMFMLFFGSLALGFYLNGLFDSNFLGFLILGGFFLLICIVLILFRDKIITNQLIQAFFSDTITREKNEQDYEEQDED